MLPARSLGRAGLPRAARASRTPRTYQTRFQSSTPGRGDAHPPGRSDDPRPAGRSGNPYTGGRRRDADSSHFAAGVAGGVAAGAVLYSVYLLTPAGKAARKINKTVKEVNRKYEEAARKLQEKTPDPDQTIRSMKEFCYSYVSWVPGGRQYVDTAFKDIEKIREKHRDEVDKIISDAYRQFQDVSRSGLSLETGSRALEVLADLSKKIGSLAGSAIQDILDNHPELKQKFGGSIDQLTQMGEQYGPEAKKQVDETWNQIKDILSGGLSASNLDKVRRLIQEKAEELTRLGDEAWKKGLEQAKPYLDKNPRLKEWIESNADALKQGNSRELFEKVKNAVESGNSNDLESYIKSVVDKAKSKGSQFSSGSSLGSFFELIPQGGEILPKLKQLKDVADKHSKEGEQLVKETLTEIKQVLDKKSQKAQDILERAKKESK
ncbi:hypothetical protein GGR53DRAFT_481997 [Hypoxylon sp. FL1150]|nr:hypothetical protein GGR53DRAFT_481997 [Hypoxylon sp. FL1150]